MSTRPQSNLDISKAEVAWDLVVRHHYPVNTVATQLRVTPEELQYMLLAVLSPASARLRH